MITYLESVDHVPSTVLDIALIIRVEPLLCSGTIAGRTGSYSHNYRKVILGSKGACLGTTLRIK